MRISEHTLNRLAVIKAIRRSAPVTRSQLPEAAGLSAGTITQLTSDLVQRGLIVERRDTAKRRGRPRIFLEFPSKGAVVLGASITGENVLTTSFVDLAGLPLHSREVKYQRPATLRDLALQIALSLETAMSQSAVEKDEICRVGIALPALVDALHGVVRFVTTFPVDAIPFAQIISNHLALPVTIENDITCMARSEHWFGEAVGLDTFTMIHVGYTLGSAEYADGVPKIGRTGLNPEFGHVKVEYGSNARKCLCGARGCLLMWSSMYGLLLQADRLTGTPFPPIGTIDERFNRLLDEAESPDSVAASLVDEAATYLGRALANLFNSSDPGTILISALSSRFLLMIQPRILGVMRENVMPGMFESTDIRFIVTKPGWRERGAAALALEQTYLETH